MMLSSSVINPVREQIMSKANKLLEDEEDVSALEHKLADVRRRGRERERGIY